MYTIGFFGNVTVSRVALPKSFGRLKLVAKLRVLWLALNFWQVWSCALRRNFNVLTVKVYMEFHEYLENGVCAGRFGKLELIKIYVKWIQNIPYYVIDYFLRSELLRNLLCIYLCNVNLSRSTGSKYLYMCCWNLYCFYVKCITRLRVNELTHMRCICHTEFFLRIRTAMTSCLFCQIVYQVVLEWEGHRYKWKTRCSFLFANWNWNT